MLFYSSIRKYYFLHGGQKFQLKFLGLTLGYFFDCYPAFSQSQYLLHINSRSEQEFEYKKKFSSESAREKELNNILISFYAKGYLAASFDTLKRDSLLLTAWLSPGDIFRWTTIKPGNTEELILNEIGFREKDFRQNPVSPFALKERLEKILMYCENNGYPFASVKLDSVAFDSTGVSAILRLSKNRKYLIDSILVTGSAKISGSYLNSYLSVKPGNLYNEQVINRISIRIKEIPFLKEIQPPQIVFTDDQCKLYLWLEEKKASSINGVLGVLPEAYDSKKTQFIGDARLKLINSFGKGELLDMNWRKMQVGTNDLKINFNYPFMFRTPFGADFNLKIYKRDTTFITIDQVYGIQYLLQGGNSFKAFIGNQQSNLISTKGYENIPVLPNFADISTTTYGIGLKAEKLDYRLNPSSGIAVEVTGSAGNKQIRKNPKVNEAAYSSIELRSIQYKTTLELDGYIPLMRRNVINLGLQSALLLNNTLFQNELFRMGGMRTLRGFDEESMNASSYAIFTFEYRFLLEQNSYFHVFIDGAYYENKSIYFTGDRYDTPVGFGSGITFDTKAGIFSLSYALGKQLDNPVLLKTGKVHFGFVNYF